MPANKLADTLLFDLALLWSPLCARFAFGSDFLIRKVFRALAEAEFEPQGSLLDAVLGTELNCHNAKKQGFYREAQSGFVEAFWFVGTRGGARLQMRLSDSEKRAIQKCLAKYFPGARLYLFGSRVDDSQKGGDIDLYLESGLGNTVERKSGFLSELQALIGEQKIDLVINDGAEDRPIYRIAKANGVRIFHEAEERLRQVLVECETHAKRLSYAASRMAAFMPLDLEGYNKLSDAQVASIDQFLYRFMKLQDAIGAKLFAGILLFLGEEVKERSAIDRLNRLEELGLIDSRADWETLRQIRNSLAHEYEEASKASLSDLNQIYAKRQALVDFYKKIRDFYLHSAKSMTEIP